MVIVTVIIHGNYSREIKGVAELGGLLPKNSVFPIYSEFQRTS
jgi:hypothetical protein